MCTAASQLCIFLPVPTLLSFCCKSREAWIFKGCRRLSGEGGEEVGKIKMVVGNG